MGAPTFMKRRALMEPARRRVFRMTPRVARTVETEGAATIFGGWGRRNQAAARAIRDRRT
jgi:hypothetical protein